jgi:hypothetical protein
MSSQTAFSENSRAKSMMLVMIFTISILASATSAQGESPTLFLRAKATVDIKIDLEWEMSNYTGVSEYNIYWDSEEIDDISGMTPDATTTSTEYTVKDLKRATKYYFVVAAVDSEGSALAHGTDYNTPGKYADIGDLKVVNYWNIMLFVGIILIIYLYVLWKIPAWVKEEREQEGI